MHFRQLLLTLNLFIIYLAIIFYKLKERFVIRRAGFVKIIFLFLQVNLICWMAAFVNNTGRYFFMLAPLLILELMLEIKPLLERNLVDQEL